MLDFVGVEGCCCGWGVGAPEEALGQGSFGRDGAGGRCGRHCDVRFMEVLGT